ncbi:hypothetical protein G7B40_028985 [Aetokthonos hydrillicola Thurmond2011]|jgi:hypothetical protein|uniref:Uncharacterized protein n=1 Tax=Aetokthonos hydrillicola Thurmond2011 TaxID=2712845 RepID=A0AAP5MBZ3_9CYAN|nr:hypothetical protein [Aetokthonos hydrillicola]MBO3462353.1 hypothetical protein [Aetokthonos hydrillicola CCALA 1050]MBW4584229.1 hypothetical protein [Aetokthonos hydrillicola CCALA 1050]MDR9898562.1 hypothetical protein [Aetokthonos hydrillicola Thurmond2011]
MSEQRMKADDRIIFRINSSEKNAFMAKVAKEGRKPSEVLIDLVRKYVQESSQTLDLEEIKQRLEQHETKLSLLEEKLLGESAA